VAAPFFLQKLRNLEDFFIFFLFFFRQEILDAAGVKLVSADNFSF